jgi:hypothetical protein
MYIIRDEERIGGLANACVVKFSKSENLNGLVKENKNLWGHFSKD